MRFKDKFSFIAFQIISSNYEIKTLDKIKKFIRKSHYSSPSNSLYWFVQLWKKLTLLIPKWGATLPIQVGLLKLSPQVREASYQMDSPAPPKYDCAI